jgi:energy-converting hydrogenase Eha subunit E
MKKLGGFFFIILGCLLTAIGANSSNTAVTVLGVILLTAGAILLILKIIRRSGSNRP